MPHKQLRERDPELRELFLSKRFICYHGGLLLAKHISSNMCPILELDLTSNRLGTHGAKAVLQALHSNRKLKKLNLSKQGAHRIRRPRQKSKNIA